MGWTLYYQLLRAEPLSGDERVAAGRFVARLAGKGWSCEPFSLELPVSPRRDGLVARGATKVGENRRARRDAVRVLAALDELRTLLTGATLRLEDDYGVAGLDDAGKPALAGTATAPLLDADDGEWTRAQAAVPLEPLSLPPKLRALVDAAARGETPDMAPFASATVAARMLKAIAKLEDDDPRQAVLADLLARMPPLVVAFAGLGDRRILERYASSNAWCGALDRLPDAGDIAAGYLAAWESPGMEGRRFDFVTSASHEFRERLMGLAEPLERMLAEAGGLTRPFLSEEDGDRLVAAIDLLGHAPTDAAHRALARIVRTFRRRRRDAIGRETWYAYRKAVEWLAGCGDPRVAPTLLLGLDERDEDAEGLNGEMAAGLARLLGAGAAPLLDRLLDAGLDDAWGMKNAALALPEAEGDALLARLARWPRREVRQAVADALEGGTGARFASVSAALDEPLPPAVDLLAWPSATVREEARSELHEARDPATAEALAQAELLDLADRGRRGAEASIPLFWGRWGEPFRRLGEVRPRDWMRWFEDHRDALPSQTVPMRLRELAEGGVEALAGAWPAFRLEASERAAAVAAEEAFLGEGA